MEFAFTFTLVLCIQVDGEQTAYWMSDAPSNKFTSMDLTRDPCSMPLAYLGVFDPSTGMEYRGRLDSQNPDGRFELKPGSTVMETALVCNETAFLSRNCHSRYNLTVSARDDGGKVILSDKWTVTVTGLPSSCLVNTTTTSATTSTSAMTTPASTTDKSGLLRVIVLFIEGLKNNITDITALVQAIKGVV
ncbi:uncharacterized protein LOC127849588 [Dreissena polymorpha]|uniref:uncharacterized protein LOC127849588 n=1 Tax=Dreissena polymorpha TaxID=45954 RepID=UPI0022644C3F|nr:uncharacterized protein LOC127849588 [Dreissena polymorpha]